MRVVIIGLVFAAIILAGGTAYLLRDYLSAQQAEIAAQAPKMPTLKVLVAGADMPIGTLVNADNTEWLDWPEVGIQDGYLVKSKDAKTVANLKNKKFVARRAFVKGEPITMARLYKSSSPGFLRGSLGPGMRAVAVRSNAENAASGFILPGDRIDVILTHSMLTAALQHAGPKAAAKFKGGLLHTSETIIENLRVLAIDQNVNEFKEGAQVGKTILLELSPKNVEKLLTAKAMGKISLALRSVRGNTKKGDRLNFTTDVEVSPMLSNFDRLLAGRKIRAPKKRKKTTSNKNKTAKAATPPIRYTPAPQAVPTRKISIYRGTAGTSTQSGNAPQ